MLIYSGYVYRLKKSTVKVNYWSCSSNGCAAVVHTNVNNVFIKNNGQHQHLPVPEHIEVRDFKWKVKQRVVNETATVPKIYEEELASANLSSVALIIAPSPADASNFYKHIFISIRCCFLQNLV